MFVFPRCFPGRSCRSSRVIAMGLGLSLFLAWSQLASATTVVHRNLGELIALSDDVLVGRVVAVDEGAGDPGTGGLPFTEVTIEVEEALRGESRSQWSFRQFGLQTSAERGATIGPHLQSPAGWPRFQVGEKVLLFLYRPSPSTGLRTTVGLEQGKFLLYGDRASNPFGNRGLLHGMETPSAEGRRQLDSLRDGMGRTYELRSSELLQFVRQAIAQGWFE